MKKRVISTLLCAAMSLALLTGCGGSGDSSETPASGTTEKTESTESAGGNVFTYAIGGDTGNTLNPLTADDRWGLMACHAVFAPPYFINQDGSIQWILAESMEPSEDGLVYTMTLKEGLTWSDGEPLTAKDIVFTYNAHNDMDSALYVGGEPIKVEAVDDRTVTFTLNTPSASVVELLSAEIFILPEHFFSAKNTFDINMLEERVVGCGPYILDEYKTGEYLKFIKNPNYANGEAAVDTLIYRVIENTDTACLAMQNKEINAWIATPDQLDPFVDNAEFNVTNYSEGRVCYLRLNSVSPNLQDVNYRKGIMTALNRDEILTAAYSSPEYYHLGYTFLPYSSSFYTEDGVEKYEQDLDKAKELTANGPKSLNLCYIGEDSVQTNMALTIQAELKAIGIDVSLEAVNSAGYMNAAYDNESTEYDMFLGGYVMGIDPDTFSELCVTTKGNMLNFHNADIDAKFKEASTILDNDERATIYSELQKMVADEALMYPFGTNLRTLVTTAEVGGLDEAQLVPIYTFGDLSKLTLE